MYEAATNDDNRYKIKDVNIALEPHKVNDTKVDEDGIQKEKSEDKEIHNGDNILKDSENESVMK